MRRLDDRRKLVSAERLASQFLLPFGAEITSDTAEDRIRHCGVAFSRRMHRRGGGCGEHVPEIPHVDATGIPVGSHIRVVRRADPALTRIIWPCPVERGFPFA